MYCVYIIGQDHPHVTKWSAKISEEHAISHSMYCVYIIGQDQSHVTKWSAKISEEYAINHMMPRVKYKTLS